MNAHSIFVGEVSTLEMLARTAMAEAEADELARLEFEKFDEAIRVKNKQLKMEMAKFNKETANVR